MLTALLGMGMGMGMGTVSAAQKPKVVATLAMIGEPVAWIAGDKAEVKSLMGPGVDPHLYRPTRRDVADLARADLILWNGLDLEAQLEEALEKFGRRVSVVAVGALVADENLKHDPTGKLDPHIWMDPALWRGAIVRAVEALKKIDPVHAPLYDQRLDTYLMTLDRLDDYADTVMATIPESRRKLVTAHDAFGYFGKRFGLEVHGIQGISTESEAGLKAIEGLVDLLVDDRIPAVFIETSVTERNVRALIEGAAARDWPVEIGGTLYSDAMGSSGTYEGTYIGMIDANVTTIANALGGTAPKGGMDGKLKQ
jgi:manganese/zinc/iron transport system substrate-binding protein